jgi:hypothetical protein
MGLISNGWIHEAPRDFFNYATLMRCLGKLSVAILDEMTNDMRLTEELDTDNPFQVEFDQHSNVLSVKNHSVYWHKGGEKVRLDLWVPYNSMEQYPLYTMIGDEELEVLDEDGKFALKLSDFATIVTVSPQEKLAIAAQTFNAVELTLRSIGPASITEVIQDLKERVVGFQALADETKTYLVQDVLAILREQGTIDMNEATLWGDENRYVIGLKDYVISRFFWIPSQVVVEVEQVFRSLEGSQTTAAIVNGLSGEIQKFFDDVFDYDDQDQKLVESILEMMRNLKLVDSEFTDDATLWRLTMGEE